MKRQWQLMTVEEISEVYSDMRLSGSTDAFRQQHSYYRKQKNVIMLDRFEQAIRIVAELKQG